MNKTFYVSDTHFGHANIIKFTNRPFSSVEEMDEAMIASWNSKVAPADLVWHLGDFSWYRDISVNEKLLSRLNGFKNLIIGNHDHSGTRNCRGWNKVTTYAEVMDEKKYIVLFHYPITEWNGMHRKSIHLHGHVHGTDIYRQHLSFDVGVEKTNYAPVTLAEILASRAA